MGHLKTIRRQLRDHI